MHLKEGEEMRGCRAPRPEYIEASAAVCSHQAEVLVTPWEALEKMFRFNEDSRSMFPRSSRIRNMRSNLSLFRGILLWSANRSTTIYIDEQRFTMFVAEVSNFKRNRSPWLFSNMNTDAIQFPSRWDVADAYWRRQHWRAAVPLAVQQQIPQRNLKTSTSTLKKFLLKRSTFKGPPVVPARRHLRQRAPQNHSSRDINNYPKEHSLGFKLS